MPIIYEPKGRAKEYADLAANLYRGCIHGCTYCYAPSATRQPAELFHSEEFVSVRKDALKILERDAAKLHGSDKNVLLSFTTDPYQLFDEEMKITRYAIQILNHHGLGVTILTKGGKLAERDFDILKLDPRNKFGVTLTCDYPEESKKWEPYAAPPEERIESLRKAHAKGIYTYVSFEPVVDPDAVYRMIAGIQGFVDFCKVGKLNYHPHSKTIDWVEFRETVVEVLEAYDIDFMLKKDLIEAGVGR